MVKVLIPTQQFSSDYFPGYWLQSGSTFSVYVTPTCQFGDAQELKGPKPRTSGRSSLGNRSCFHPNLKGAAYGFTLQPDMLKPDDLCYPFYKQSRKGQILELPATATRPLRLQVNNKESKSTTLFEFRTLQPNWHKIWGLGDWYCDVYHYNYQDTPLQPGQKYSHRSWNVRKYDPKKLYLQSAFDGEYQFRDLVAVTAETLARLVPRIDMRETFGSLNDECAASAKYVDCNTSMLLRELLRLKTDTTRLAQLLRGKIDIKTLSSLYLNYKYGARLTIKDANLILDKVTDRLFDLIPEQDLYRVHSRKTLSLPPSGIFLDDWSVECVSTIWYRPAPQWTLDRSLYNLMQWDIFPSFQNIWDFIPYSFVVDWFLDVEGALKSLDNQAQWALCQVVENAETVKYSNRVDAGILSKHFTGELTFTMYNREIKNTLTTRQFHFTPSLTATHHVAELTALIAQRV